MEWPHYKEELEKKEESVREVNKGIQSTSIYWGQVMRDRVNIRHSLSPSNLQSCSWDKFYRHKKIRNHHKNPSISSYVNHRIDNMLINVAQFPLMGILDI